MKIQLTDRLRRYIEDDIRVARESRRDWLSSDGSAVMVQGSIGYACFISPDGEAFIENDDRDGIITIDRSHSAAIETITLGVKYNQEISELLAELIPPRPQDATTCDACSGIGFLSIIPSREPTQLCLPCHGLGWISPTFFQDETA